MTTNRSAEKKSGRTIQPLCFTPDTELQETICTMSFPEGIKNELVELNRCIYRDVNPKFQLRNTYMIRSAILNWMDAAVEVKNLKRDSDDSRWLVMIKHGEQSVDRELISRIIVTWLYDNYPRSLLEKCANGDAVMLTKLQEMRSRAISCAAPENTGVYFFAYRQHALDWIKHRRYKNKKTAVLSAIFEYNDIEYLDLDDPSNIDKLNATVQTIIETSEDTEFDLSSLSIEEKRNIYCNMYRRAYPNTKVISYTFSRNHEPYTVAGYKKNQKQFCVIDPSLIKNIQIEWCDENGIKL